MSIEKNVSIKNYILLAVVLILSIIVVIYFYMWYSEFNSNKENITILNDCFSVINYNEVDDYLVENKDVTIYISSYDERIRSFEKKLKANISKYNISNIILYLDLTSEKDNTNLYNKILNDYSLSDLPSIIVFNDGSIYDIYNIKKNKYDVDLLISYLKMRGIIYD